MGSAIAEKVGAMDNVQDFFHKLHLAPAQSIEPSRENQNLPETQPLSVKDILSSPLFVNGVRNPERIQMEQELTDNVKSIDEVDEALAGITDYDYRDTLLEKRAKFAKEEKRVFLTDDEKGWLEEFNASELEKGGEQQIAQDTLLLCKEAEPIARELIGKMLSFLRADLPLDSDPALVMPNIGGMAALLTRETDGLRNIGTRQALSQINPEEFPNDRQALKALCKIYAEEFGYKYVPENIPGSEWVDPENTLSGGAIGPQFMPSRALEIYELMSAYGYKPNIFKPVDALVATWVFLARDELQYPRYGYQRGHPNRTYDAWQKWNSLESEIQYCTRASESFYTKVLSKEQIAQD